MHPLFLITAAMSSLFLAGRAFAGSKIPKGSAPKWKATQDDLIARVRAGEYELEWQALPGYSGVEASRDALRIEGVRVPVSARTLDAICVLLEATPTTPLIEDVIYDNATVRIAPATFNTADPEAVWRFNQAIDLQLDAQLRGSPLGGFVSDVGKSWVISNLSLDHRGRAINYGLHSPSAPYRSVNGKSKVWQQPSWAHNPDHWDYSQTARLCRLASGVELPSLEKLRTHQLWSPSQ
jgi:hypothetical protein